LFGAAVLSPVRGVRLRFDQCEQRIPMLRMRHPHSGPDARASRERQSRRGCDLPERECVELRRDLALEPRLVALVRMLARPAAIAAMQAGPNLVRVTRVKAFLQVLCRGQSRTQARVLIIQTPGIQDSPIEGLS